MSENLENPVMYIIVPNNMPSLNPGKAMAHTAHAGSKICFDFFTNKEYWSENTLKLFDMWLNQGNGFGTKIVLEGSLQDINNLLNYVEENTVTSTLHYSEVTDPTYPFWVDSEVTPFLKSNVTVTDVKKLIDGKIMTLCTRQETTAYYFFGDKNVIGSYFSGFELMR